MELTILEQSNILLPIMHVVFGESERAITVELIIKQFAWILLTVDRPPFLTRTDAPYLKY